MFWSRKSKMVASIAGPIDAKITQVRTLKTSTNHGLPEVVPIVSGTFGVLNFTSGKSRAKMVIAIIARAGPKSLRKFLNPELRKEELVRFLRFLARTKVPRARITLRKALERPKPSGPNALTVLLTASIMKITETRAAKISSVNRVKYFINALASVKAHTSSNTPDQIPTHV
jgi:hypothetical protein